MVKAPMLSPTPTLPSSASLSPTNEDTIEKNVGILIDTNSLTSPIDGELSIVNKIDSVVTTIIATTETTTVHQSTSKTTLTGINTKLSNNKNCNENKCVKKVKIRFNDLVMADCDKNFVGETVKEVVVCDLGTINNHNNKNNSKNDSNNVSRSDSVDETDDVRILSNCNNNINTINSNNEENKSTRTTTTINNCKTDLNSNNNNNNNHNKFSDNQHKRQLSGTITTSIEPQIISPITIGITHSTPPPSQAQSSSIKPTVVNLPIVQQQQKQPHHHHHHHHQQQQLHQLQPPQLQSPSGPSISGGGHQSAGTSQQLQIQQQSSHHHHHHLFPVHVISIPQPPPPGSAAAAAAVSGAWPPSIVEAPIYVDSNGEPRHYCPAHSQGPAREHRVLLQLDAGVSLPLQIAGKRKVFRGPTTVQMVSQNRPPPIPVPVQVPQGQVMQQYVNESGTLTHVVLSPTQYQQLHAGQGGVPHIHAPFITTNGTTSHFYGPLTATGFPGPGGGPHFHPMPGGHLQPQQMSHSPHSPSPPTIYHKDERTQRQHTKLLRKLDQKREMNSAMSTPAHSPSPRKNEMNGLRRTSRNGASSVGTSEDGEESSSVPDEEDDCQAIIEQLSAVQQPEVTDITSRSAMLRWEAPPISENIVNSRDLRYDVLLSDRGKEGKYKIIFKGESYVCMIQDLRPGQEYFVCLQVHYEKLQGSASEPTVFTTPPCEPDQPLPPKLIARTKNSLQLRWNASNDNGSHIINYILECDEGKGKDFVEIIKTKGKQYTLPKLQPSTFYNFRLLAVNEYGPSIYSDIIKYSTSGNPPQTPKPPTLQSSTSSSLRLAWERRAQDEEFVLQMADKETGHGFLNMYNGLDTIYECKGLKRATAYHFRLKSDNEAGSSTWSNEVSYKTQPEKPGRPGKPQVKGKIHGTYFKAKWDPPNDRGGAEIRKYFLEISSGEKFEPIYNGGEPETICDRLSPGTTYQVRVSCEGPGGTSGYSDIFTVTTEAIVPGAPEAPSCSNAPGPYAAVLKWDKPDYNGGAPVLEYEIQLNGLNHDNEIIYRGKDTFCVVKDLNPGEKYQAHVRAVNRIGAGAWSDILKFLSGSAPPYAPDTLKVCVRSSTHLTISWNEPLSNGSRISRYRLESSIENDNTESFQLAYQGIHTRTDLRNLVPFTLYYFRVSAINDAGTSPFSSIVETQTPAAIPSIPEFDHYEATSNEITLHWVEPQSNGSNILYYVIEYNGKSLQTNGNVIEETITNLASETCYKFRIQAVNEIGASQFSTSYKINTLPPPPKPPKLECIKEGNSYFKLKWGEGRNIDYIKYYIEIYNNKAKEFQIVYNGTGLTCKVSKLQEKTSYTFRIHAESILGGTGDYSIEYIFTTRATIPNNIRTIKIIDSQCRVLEQTTNNSTITTTTSMLSPSTIHHQQHNTGGHVNNSIGITGSLLANVLTVEWTHSKNIFTDPIEYVLECSLNKEQDYKEIWRGRETRYVVENLDYSTTYFFRILPIRIQQNNSELPGVYSTTIRYQMPSHKTIFEHSNVGQICGVNNGGVNCGQLAASTNHLYHRSILSGGSGGTVSGIINDHHHHHVLATDEMTSKTNSGSANGGGAIRRVVSKLTAIHSNRKRISDQEKAILWMIFFMVATICFAAFVRMFMR